MPLRFDTTYRIDRGENLGDPEVWNKRFQDLDLRLGKAEEGEDRRDSVAEALVQLTLDRVNQTILPAYNQLVELVNQIQGGGFLIAASETEITLAVGEQIVWYVTDPADRAAFRPTAFFAATRESTPDDWAIVQLISWDGVTGELVGEVSAVFGSAGPHDDWVLAALAGPTVASTAILAEVSEARDATIEAAEDAAAAAASVGTAASDAAESASDAAAAASAAAGSQSAAAASAAAAAASAASVDAVAIDGRLDTLETAMPGKQATSEKGAANGYASLNGSTEVPAAQLPIASAAQTQQAATGRLMTPENTKAAFAYLTLTDATTIAWDQAIAYPNVQVTLGGNRVFGAPTNVVAGTSGYLRIVQGSGGNKVPTWNAVFKNTADIEWSTAAGAVDFFHWTAVAGASGTVIIITQIAKGI